jgi:hypothetical protein
LSSIPKTRFGHVPDKFSISPLSSTGSRGIGAGAGGGGGGGGGGVGVGVGVGAGGGGVGVGAGGGGVGVGVGVGVGAGGGGVGVGAGGGGVGVGVGVGAGGCGDGTGDGAGAAAAACVVVTLSPAIVRVTARDWPELAATLSWRTASPFPDEGETEAHGLSLRAVHAQAACVRKSISAPPPCAGIDGGTPPIE